MTEETQSLADLFVNNSWEEFDELPLPLQKLKYEQKKFEYELYLERYKKNSGIKGGRPREWSDELLEQILHLLDAASKSEEYKDRKDPREKEIGITAYVILLEWLYAKEDTKKFLSDHNVSESTIKRWQKENAKTAKKIKVRVDEYLKRKKNGT